MLYNGLENAEEVKCNGLFCKYDDHAVHARCTHVLVATILLPCCKLSYAPRQHVLCSMQLGWQSQEPQHGERR